MSIVRAAGRTLLASYFIAAGIKAIKDPTPLVPAAEPLADKVVPLVKQYAPAEISNYIPEDAKTWVRINGAAEIVGGVALATGFGRRLGALLLAGTLVPSTIAKYPFWTRTDPEQRADERQHFLKNASLLGGVLIAAVDTEGKPSLSYRAHKGGQSLAKDTKKAGRKVARSTSGLTKDTKKAGRKVARSTSALTNAALAEGAMLAGAVVSQSRKARKQAAKQAAEARKAAERAAKPVIKDARHTAKDAQKQFAKAQKQAGKAVGNLSDDAGKKAAELSKAASKRAAELQKDAQQQIKKAQKAVGDVTSNITLGDN